METIEKGQTIELAVLEKKTVNSRQCYIIETPDNRRHAISLLRFQFDEPVPAKLRFIVKDINSISGELTLEQDFGSLLRRFYETGKEYTFTVIKEHLASKKRKTFSLADNYGFMFNLHESVGTKLYAHQQVKCVVTDFIGNKLTLRLSDSSRQQSDKSKDLQQRITEALANYSHRQQWDRTKFVELVFSSQEIKIFDEQCTSWLQSELLESADQMHDTLEEIHEVCLYLLEGCDILKNEKQSERAGLQERISKLVDLTERFVEAVEIVEKDVCDNYIDSLLTKLSCSGYIYHPNHKLGILITIFTLRTELMENRMDSLLDVIHQSTLDYWRQEPFRSAFIRLLEMYIKARRKNADLLSVGASLNVRSIVKALSVQLLLINTIDADSLDKLPCDLPVNRAMLYRYSSYFMTRSPKTLLERSFRSLMEMNDPVMYYNWEDTKNVELLANKLSAFIDNEPTEEIDNLQQHEYKGAKARLRIGNSGISICANTSEETFPVLPTELNLWHQLQVMLPDTLSRKTRVGVSTLKPYKQMWTEIEQSIFEEKPVVKKTFRKIPPEKGQEVYIRVSHVEGDNLYCVIEEDSYKGEGTMAVSDVIDWNARVYDECFIDECGYPLLMKAKVTRVGIDGTCNFVMKRLIREWVHEEMIYGEKYIMKVKSLSGNTANGITHEGYPMTATIPAEFDAPVNPGDFLEVIMDSDDNLRRSNVSVSAIKHVVARWDETLAFMNLMSGYAEDVLDDNGDEMMEDVLQEGAELSSGYIRELILLFDRQAAVELTIRSFNCLGVARLLSLLIGDKELAEYYKWRMALLEMLQDFSINEKVDATKLEELQKAAPDIFAPGSQLRLRFMQIMAISCQGHPERNPELWKMISEEKDESLQELASMVLSWNFTADKEMERAQEDINARIFNLLSLKQRKSTRKSFGKESKVVEFKTSMVYPPENHFRADLKVQTLVILKEVAAFLNTEGGTLYLGVNNEGVAEGLENDLAFRLFCYSQDKYDIYFHNQIKAMLGLEANSLVSCEWEEADDKQIYVVKVKPCPHVVLLNGTIYERQDTSSEPLTGAYRDEFLKKRPLLVAQMLEPKIPEVKDAKPKAAPVAKVQESDVIATSGWRKNVLFDWEPEYIEPARYLSFQPDNKFVLSTPAQPPYNSEDYSLSLVIADEETGGYLVQAFDNGKVCRVAMKEILEKNNFTAYNRVQDKLVFACPAMEGDFLFTVLRDDHGIVYYRTDKVDTLYKTRITDDGELFSSTLTYEIIYADIIPARLAHCCKETPGKALGVNAMMGTGPAMRENIERELGITLP